MSLYLSETINLSLLSRLDATILLSHQRAVDSLKGVSSPPEKFCLSLGFNKTDCTRCPDRRELELLCPKTDFAMMA